MKTKIKLFVITAFILAIFSSCYDGPAIFGNNEIVEETRPLPNFDEVTSSGSFNIYYTHGDSSSVRIEAESNLIPYIETSVFNDRLNIRFALHINVHLNHDVEIYVTSPSVRKIHLSGSGKIEADSVSGNSLKLDVSGSGNIQSHFYGGSFKSTISGSGFMDIVADCDSVDTNISGSGRIDLKAYDCMLTEVTISGSGKAEMTGSSDVAELKILGSGRISAYEFQVKEADVTVSGSGDVYINVTDFLDALLSGSGNLHYIGTPRINFNTSGSGKLINEN